VAKGTIKDLMDSAYKFVVVGGDMSYSDGYLAVWEDWFDMMEPAISKVPLFIGDGNHESGLSQIFSPSPSLSLLYFNFSDCLYFISFQRVDIFHVVSVAFCLH